MTDSSGNNNHGTLSKTESGLNGFQGLAYYFGRIGLPSFVEVPHSATLNPGTADITLSMYAKFPKVPPAAVGDYDMVRRALRPRRPAIYKMEIVPRNSGTIGRAYCLFKGTSGSGVVQQGPELSDDQGYYIFHDGLSRYGHTNSGPAPLKSTGPSCFVPDTNGRELRAFEDGRQRLTFTAPRGSVRISRVVVTATGTR